MTAWSPSTGRIGLIIDLGANRGEFALAAARLNPGLDVLAIEPIPALADAIEASAVADGLGNLRCLCIAVDETSGQATLNVQSSYDQGVSSLLGFDRASLQRDEYWRERPDLAFDAAIPVTVRRLDELLPEDPPPIRFAKIDVQGRDVQALRSLGRHLPQLDGGMLEIPGALGNRLYEAEIIDLGGAIAELRAMGFEIYAVKPNDPAGNEYNLFFHRRGTDWRRMEEELGLRRIPLYSGKHFWHLPADRLRHPEAEFAELHHGLAEANGRIESISRDLADALASADELRAENAALHASAAALRQTIERQRQRCALLEAERLPARQVGGHTPAQA